VEQNVWTRSNRCGESSHCVEVFNDGKRIRVRPSHARELEVRFTFTQWQEFIEGVCDGEFDLW
jgi:hypothetical protein